MPMARCPYSQYELGDRYNRKLNELAVLRHRSPRAQALQLLQWALERACEGDDVELTQAQLAIAGEQLTEVA